MHYSIKQNQKVIAYSNQECIPYYVYKYMEREWADDFLRGRIRLSELHQYQKNEHIAGVHDAQEGLKQYVEHNVNGLYTRERISANSAMRGAIQIAHPGSNYICLGAVGSWERSAKALSFCCSESANDWEMAKDMNPNYDTCIQIEIIPFIARVGRSLKGQSFIEQAVRFLKVKYTGRTVDYVEGDEVKYDHDELKSSEYENQKEWRILWSGKETTPDHFPIEDRKLCKYISVSSYKPTSE